MNVKGQPTEKEKLFANHISDEGRTQNYKNNLAQKEQKHQVTQCKRGQRHSRMVVTRSWGEGERKNCFLIGVKFQIYKMTKFRRSVSQQCE